MSKALRELRHYASTLLAEEAEPVAVPVGTRRATLAWRPLQVALPVMVLLVFGNIGLAAAADNAVPGDALYPVDRAYERIASVFGIDAGATDERLAEASVLLAKGNYSVAVAAIADSAAEADGDIDERIRQVGAELSLTDTAAVDREDMHRSVAALASTVGVINASNTDPSAWIDAVDASTQAIIDVVEGLPFELAASSESSVPSGQIDTPPGQNQDFVPPGQDENRVPPGQDENRVPPGQDENRIPPGQEHRGNNE